MAKLRRPRQVLGTITRADGVRVEVKNPTVWKAIAEQAAALEVQRNLLDGLQAGIAKLEAERDHYRAWAEAHDAHWWVRLGVWLRLCRVIVVTAEPRDGSRPDPTVIMDGKMTTGTTPAAVTT